MFKRLLVLTIVGLALLASTVLAEVSGTMTVQGRLTDATGAPITNGAFLYFKIFDLTTGGTQIWPDPGVFPDGFQSVAIASEDGLWSTELGEAYGSLALTDEVFAMTPRWLEITVQDLGMMNPPETMPRVVLRSSPYAYRVSTVDSASGGTILGTLKLGTPTESGGLSVYMNGASNPVVGLGNYSGDGGQLELFDENHTKFAMLEADASGEGGFLAVYGNSSSYRFRVEGNYSAGSPEVAIIGSGSSTYFRSDLAGDVAVQLPIDAVGNSEIVDEPGVASYRRNTTQFLTGSMDNLASRSISVPGAGYVLVVAHCRARINHTSGSISGGTVGLSDNTTSFADNQDLDIGVATNAVTGTYYTPVGMTALFEVPSAATYTYYVLGHEGSGDIDIADIQLNLVYFPTAYGTVMPTFAKSDGSVADGLGEPAGMTQAEVDAEIAETEVFNVDRIERELAAMKAKIEAMQDQLDNNENERR